MVGTSNQSVPEMAINMMRSPVNFGVFHCVTLPSLILKPGGTNPDLWPFAAHLFSNIWRGATGGMHWDETQPHSSANCVCYHDVR